ncbi:hypothetical protein EV03_0126 [Prochlorococcus marinus str. PAC1]|uniref:Uncharacterized protein n=1 Tax=Prochlorococcus marinus str. PAC1 TaxID=59924 RepID=A0A0A2C7W5_PROMR|nr:hypothetical protein EV03_0126 [Prochlorococcus marinus str. PAC1]
MKRFLLDALTAGFSLLSLLMLRVFDWSYICESLVWKRLK